MAHDDPNDCGHDTHALLSAAMDLALSGATLEAAGEQLRRLAASRPHELDLARVELLREGLPPRRAAAEAAAPRGSLRNRTLSILDAVLARPAAGDGKDAGPYVWHQVCLDDWENDPLPEPDVGVWLRGGQRVARSS